MWKVIQFENLPLNKCLKIVFFLFLIFLVFHFAPVCTPLNLGAYLRCLTCSFLWISTVDTLCFLINFIMFGWQPSLWTCCTEFASLSAIGPNVTCFVDTLLAYWLSSVVWSPLSGWIIIFPLSFTANGYWW